MDITDGRRNSGVGGAAQRLWKRKNVRIFVSLLCITLAGAFIVSIFVMYKGQQQKLNEIAAEKAKLQERIDELSREQERLESKVEYMNSADGLLQYAREHLGYIFPNDKRFDLNIGDEFAGGSVNGE